jgi:predicted restriction endonuclease
MAKVKKNTEKYLEKLWRQAVLANYGYRCAKCGNTIIHEIECHHIVKRRHKILRWDYRNGIPGCKYTCHKYYHTKEGEAFIMRNHRDYDHICDLETVLYKQYLADNKMTDAEFRVFRKEEMKQFIRDMS